MAEDILTPIQLVDDFSTIYVICMFDSAFTRGETFENQQADIRQSLELGNDEFSHHREVYLKYDDVVQISRIDEPCSITKETNDPYCWSVDFSYKGIDRYLVYFHHMDFRTVWPYVISDISHLMAIGTPFPADSEILQQMVAERCNGDCLYYTGSNVLESDVKVKSRGGTTISITGTEMFAPSNTIDQ